MKTAFVFITTRPNVDADAVRSLRVIKGVEEVHSLYGVYDMAIKIKAENVDRIKEIVRNIRQLNLLSTLTLMSYDEEPTDA